MDIEAGRKGSDNPLPQAPILASLPASKAKISSAQAELVHPSVSVHAEENAASIAKVESKDWEKILSSIYLATPTSRVTALETTWYERKKQGIFPNLEDDKEVFTRIPKLPKLPPHLVPWLEKLNRWETSTHNGMDGRKLPSILRNTSIWSASGPLLPDEAEPWIITLGIDPGPTRSDEGFTTPLLVAAPESWFPDSHEVAFFGPWGEMLLHKCDGTMMRIPREWWDRWAYGAMADGALYYVLP